MFVRKPAGASKKKRGESNCTVGKHEVNVYLYSIYHCNIGSYIQTTNCSPVNNMRVIWSLGPQGSGLTGGG